MDVATLKVENNDLKEQVQTDFPVLLAGFAKGSALPPHARILGSHVLLHARRFINHSISGIAFCLMSPLAFFNNNPK